MVSSNLFWGSSSSNAMDSFNIDALKYNRTNDFSSDFHIYRLDWFPDYIKFYVDDELTGQVKKAPSAVTMAPFDQPV